MGVNVKRKCAGTSRMSQLRAEFKKEKGSCVRIALNYSQKSRKEAPNGPKNEVFDCNYKWPSVFETRENKLSELDLACSEDIDEHDLFGTPSETGSPSLEMCGGV